MVPNRNRQTVAFADLAIYVRCFRVRSVTKPFVTCHGYMRGLRGLSATPSVVLPMAPAEDQTEEFMTATAKATMRIFLAEDNPADVYLIERALREHKIDFQLELAENGKQALSFLRQIDGSASDRLPSLIVLDLNLPQHDGAEILQRIRQTRSLASVPVVVLTSSDSPRDQLTALESGASRYIRKPSNLQDFMAIGAALKELLEGGARVQRADSNA